MSDSNEYQPSQHNEQQPYEPSEASQQVSSQPQSQPQPQPYQQSQQDGFQQPQQQQPYQQAGFQQPQPQQQPYQQAGFQQQPPYGQQPYYGVGQVGAKSKIAAGILGILLGAFGAHKFYLGYTGAAVAMLLITLLTFGIGAIVMEVFGIIEGIIYLTKSDYDFYYTYEVNQKTWF